GPALRTPLVRYGPHYMAARYGDPGEPSRPNALGAMDVLDFGEKIAVYHELLREYLESYIRALEPLTDDGQRQPDAHRAQVIVERVLGRWATESLTPEELAALEEQVLDDLDELDKVVDDINLQSSRLEAAAAEARERRLAQREATREAEQRAAEQRRQAE